MRIGVLGWGSLIWDPRELQLAGGRLTLVIDENHGVDVPTRYAVSSLTDLDLAVTDLQEREGTPYRDRIGFADLLHNRNCQRAQMKHPSACERVRAWAGERQFDAVVWTAIGPRFREKTGEPFSIDAAVRYFARLPEQTKALALDYIRNAPADVKTPVRQKIVSAFGPAMKSASTALKI